MPTRRLKLGTDEVLRKAADRLYSVMTDHEGSLLALEAEKVRERLLSLLDNWE